MATKVQKIMTQPINLIFRFLQNKTRVQIWLYENTELRIEGKIIGFDEYMNLVLDEAEELLMKKKERKPLGRILLKGDSITLMMTAQSS
ncbi:small nuclear ribonucleo protein [Emiliania huxleyi CCMP1516]|uniref:Small nuclear ribonucleoprotein E n=2 Tax=Emiliania huxleyi TaxID=2903 RepID=A0A0D3JF49_EMIH1|nr:hypothetical protein EMIHUDRAFT_74860 [Emiliania huxleyi CCMP1516]XP_005774563.1 small nuclear ribonucleo protein [Emiliania huxleyi CCMP1516]EOD21539.1 hypothetical protein EMIHUDRAFT_74860 [Emiliania huxleyi CCMP1516]EOD22134.1 small nuclear ribonucleo protein [Emiliania huxleyi CCMP1516]|mmetsp:Transcript_48754/g.157935  ORF Transcript_48754/g.157935 Transcript_48754/m.157935 type:complete len:89 (+) Transcript_48754:85-351(+)|eukprot:XP_005773968.1 hypothetical protein EMIHUDRAFT_74860 [Emiliania huxleyi CCMP1516]